MYAANQFIEKLVNGKWLKNMPFIEIINAGYFDADVEELVFHAAMHAGNSTTLAP